MKRRYTAVYHSYIGYGSYCVEFRRILCNPRKLQSYVKGDLHFFIKGWPDITHPDGELVVAGRLQ